MVPAPDTTGAWSRLDVGSPAKLASPSRSLVSSRRSDVSSKSGSNAKYNGKVNGSNGKLNGSKTHGENNSKLNGTKSDGALKERPNGNANRTPSRADSDADSYRRASLDFGGGTMPPTEKALLARSNSDTSAQPKQKSPPSESARSYVSSYVESETSSVRAGKAPREKAGKRHVHACRPGLGHHGGGKRRSESEMLNDQDLQARDQSPSRQVKGRCICEICTCEHCSCAAHAPHPSKKITPFVGISRHEETYRPFTEQERRDVYDVKEGTHAQSESKSCPWNKGAQFQGEAQTRSDFQPPPAGSRPKSYKEQFSVDPKAETDTRRTADEIAKHKFNAGTVYQECYVEQPIKSGTAKLASKMRNKTYGDGKVQGPWGIQTAWKSEGTTATRSAHRDFTMQEFKDSRPPQGVCLRLDSDESPWQYQSDQGFFQGKSTSKADFHAFSKEELLQSPAHTAAAKKKMQQGDCRQGNSSWAPTETEHKTEMITTYGREFKKKEKDVDSIHGKQAPVRDFWTAYEGKLREDDRQQALWFAATEVGPGRNMQQQRSVMRGEHRAFTTDEQKEGRPCATRSLRMESPNGPFDAYKGATMQDSKTVSQNDFAPPPREAYGHIGADKQNAAARQGTFLDEQRRQETRDFQTTSRGTHNKPERHHCPAKKLLREQPPPAPPAGREHVYYDEVAKTWY